MARGPAWWGGMHGRGDMHGKGGMHGREACVAGGMHGSGVCMAGGMSGRYFEIRSMSRWYASYWNVFF